MLKDIALSLEDAYALAALLPVAEVRGEFGPDELTELRQIIEHLDSLGVALTVEENGRWSLDELRTVHEAVSDVAKGTARILQEATGIEDDLLGFRLLYAPLLISRDPRDSVSPKPAEVWFAKNSNG
jgi:hypothetical protein